MAFTSWSALKTQILDAIADGDILTSEYSIGGRTQRFRSMDEVEKILNLCDRMLGSENGGMTAYANFKDPGSSE